MKTKYEMDIMQFGLCGDRDKKIDIEFERESMREIDKYLSISIYEYDKRIQIKFRYSQIIELNNFLTMCLKTDKGLII